MKFQPDILSGSISVNAVDDASVVINGRRFTQAVLFGTARAPIEWSAVSAADCVAAASALVEQWRGIPGVILFGTGSRQQFPPTEVRRLWAAAGLVVEVMDTPAACRTFNLLAGEGRDVNAALLLAAPQQAST